MAKASLHSDNGHKREYKTPNGRIITLIYDEDDNSITFEENGKRIGDEFKFIDEDVDEDGFGNRERFLLARMYAPIKESGLGRAAVEFFRDMTKATIYTRPNDGIVREDGSHLTEDAPGFVMKLQKEGLIENWSY